MQSTTANSLTIVTPVKISTREELGTALESATSLYRTLGNERPVHLLSTLITDAGLRREYFGALASMRANVSEIAKDQNYMQAFRTLMGAIETRYGYFHSADVVTSTDRNFFLPCIEAMDQNEKLVQIRIGGYPISNYDTNWDIFGIHDKLGEVPGGEPIHPDATISLPQSGSDLKPVATSTGDVVWTISMAARLQRCFYAIPFWNCVMRKTFIDNIFQATDPLVKKGEWSMSEYLGHINGAPDMVDYSMGKTDVGWPPPYEFIENLEQGLLNLSCYVYALGRESRPLEEFKKVNMVEIHSPRELYDKIKRVQ